VEWGGGEFPAGVDGFGFFRVITMEVEEKWYCHPDIVMFLQPGQSLDVPTQVVTVQSYDVKFHVKANDKDLQYASPGGPIRDAIVKVGRAKSLHDQAPACFPKDEIKINDFGHLMIGSPQKNIMTGDTGVADINGNITFRRLVKHDGVGGCGGMFGEGPWPSDVYYVEARSHPTQGDLNYHIERKKQFAPCEARLPILCGANECVMRSANYKPPLVEYEITLLPLFPKILAYSQSVYNNVPYALPNTHLILIVWHANGDFRLKPYKTDANGHFSKQFTTGDMPELLRTQSNGELTPRYAMDYFKSGFKRKQCNTCGDLNNKQVLQYGQKWDIDVFLEPKSAVKGLVEDEHGQPIYGDVKIGDGPYMPLEMKYQLVQGVDPGQGQIQIQPQGQVQPQGQGQVQPQGQVQGQPQGQVQVQPQTQGQAQGQQGGQFSPADPGIPGLIQQGGFNVEFEAGGPMQLGNFEQVSVFHHPAQSGQQIPLIVRPDASNYFADTFLVNIPSNYEGDYYDLGKFVIKERLHRPVITVYHKVLGFGPDQLPKWYDTPLEGAEVILSNLPKKVTNANGKVSYVFGSPSNEFRLRINKPGYIPYDQYVTIPASKKAFEIEIMLELGKTLTGTVTRAAGGQAIEGARVYTEIGSNNYGPIVIEAFSDQSGAYTLDGLPTGLIAVQASKADSAVTYIGQTKNVNTAQTLTLNFQLVEAPFMLPHIWNLPVAIESVTPSGNNWIVSGAFVGLPHNARFKPEDESD
jgi:hypothetical protein